MKISEYLELVFQEVKETLDISKWEVSDNTFMKFKPDGTYLKFYGDTVVIPLDRDDIKKIKKIQDFAYEILEGYLSEPLPPSTFHVTIHDLNNPLDTPGDLISKVKETQKIVKKIFKELSKYKCDVIKLKAVGVIGVPTAVGIGFVPLDEDDFKILMDIHSAFHLIRPINKFIPHVTLGYFKPVEYDEEEVGIIKDGLKKISDETLGISIKLPVKNLSYQVFRDMKTYETVFTLESIS